MDKGVCPRVEDEELDAIAVESAHTIDIDHFVPKSQIDERYVDSPYYLVPENKVGLEAFAVIRDAMPGRRYPTIRHATNAPPPPSCVGPNSASVLHRRPRGRLRQLWGSAPAPPRASPLHQSSFRNLRLPFNYRSQMSQLTETHPNRRLSNYTSQPRCLVDSRRNGATNRPSGFIYLIRQLSVWH